MFKNFKMISDTGSSALHCKECQEIMGCGYHPSLDSVIALAKEHQKSCPVR